MDAYVNTRVLEEMRSDMDNCKKKLDQCIVLIKHEYRIADAVLAGEQFEKFKVQAETACQNITQAIDGLQKAAAFLKELEPEIHHYDGTRY